MINLAIEKLGILPDELLDRLDPGVYRPRRCGSEQLSEILAEYRLQDEERKTGESTKDPEERRTSYRHPRMR